MLAPAAFAADDAWPTRPVTMIVPFAAGGPVDITARLMAAHLPKFLGQAVIVENIPGAGSMTGANRVAQAAPDGSVFLYGNSSTHTFSQIVNKKPPYDAMTDFAPVAAFVENSKVLMVRQDLPVKDLAEFIAYTRTNQKTMQFGSAGLGSAAHISCVLINLTIGVEVTAVPYRGLGPAMQDLMAGRIDYACDIVSSAVPHIKSGNVRATGAAVAEPERRAAGPADRRRAGPQGPRSRRLERVLLPEGDAGRDRTQARQGDQRHPRHPGSARPPDQPRAQHRGAGAPHARVRRGSGEERPGKMARADFGQRHRAAVTAGAAAGHTATSLGPLSSDAQHAIELVAAPDDQPGGGHHAVGALAARQAGIFLDAVDRHFRGAAEHREHGAVLEEVDRVIAPLAGGDHAAVEAEDAVEFAPVEGHLVAGGGRLRCRPRKSRSVRFRRMSCGASLAVARLS